MIENTNDPKDWLGPTYEKSSLKLVIETLVINFKQILRGNFKSVIEQINRAIKISRERREHLKRRYPRERKYSRKTFPHNNLVERR